MTHLLNSFGSIQRLVVILTITLLAGLVTAPTQAAILVPPISGQFPDVFEALTGATLLASDSSGPVISSNGLLHFSVVSAVYSDPDNTFGANDLDFVYQVTNSDSSTDSVGRVTAINFTGRQTDVGFDTAGSSLPGSLFSDGTIAPGLVDRNSGDVIGFQFASSPTSVIGPGQVSNVLLIETDATTYTTGELNVIDGGVSTVTSFGPTPISVPEPASALAIGLLSSATLRRWRR